MALNSVLCLLTILAYSNGAVVMNREDNNGTASYGIHKPSSNDADTLPTPFIYGGRDAEVGAFPWIVHLRSVVTTATRRYLSQKISFCGGSLISDRHVLSAAHCIRHDLKQYHNVEIYLGEYNTKSYGKDCAKGKCVYNRRVYPDKIIPHPQYNSAGNGNNDIALLRLEQRIRPTPSIQPIPLIPFDVDTPEFAGRVVVVAGWGHFNRNNDSPEVLQTTVMQLVPKSQCRHRILGGVPPSSFCSLSTETKNTCHGDSGGPAVMYYGKRYYLAGIVSMGPTCGLSGYSTFSNVFRHMKWIKSHMN